MSDLIDLIYLILRKDLKVRVSTSSSYYRENYENDTVHLTTKVDLLLKDEVINSSQAKEVIRIP